MRPEALTATSTMASVIACLAALPPGPGFEPDTVVWVADTLGADPMADATAAWGAAWNLPETMVGLLHAFFAYRADPKPEAMAGLLRALRDVTTARLIGEAQGDRLIVPFRDTADV